MADSGTGRQRGSTRTLLAAALVVVLGLFTVPLAAYMKWVDWPWIGPPEHLRLAAYEGDVGALEWIARDFGFYDQAGIEVELTGHPSGKAAVDALKTGQADIATASEFVVVTEDPAASGLRILTSISYYWNKGVVGRRDRGIAAPADLRGKRIAVTSPSGAEYSLGVFLALNRLTVDDVTLVKLPPQKLVEAVVAGDVDAAITWQPHVQQIETALGANAASFSGEGFDVFLLLVTRADQVGDAGRATRRLLRALVMAEEWVRAHPDEAKAYLVRRFGLDAAYVEAQWRRMQLAVNLPQEVLVAMDGEARWLARRDGRGEAAIPNYAKSIHADELRAVKPAAVGVLAARAPGRAGFLAAIAGR